MQLLVRALTAAEAAAIATWHYEPPFDIYDCEAPPLEGYFPVLLDGHLAGFVCIGEQARVTGQLPVDDMIDVGAGLRPDLLGQGLGTALLALVVERYPGRRLRAAVAAFNERSVRLCRSAGFTQVCRFPGPGGREFVELIREP